MFSTKAVFRKAFHKRSGSDHLRKTDGDHSDSSPTKPKSSSSDHGDSSPTKTKTSSSDHSDSSPTKRKSSSSVHSSVSPKPSNVTEKHTWTSGGQPIGKMMVYGELPPKSPVLISKRFTIFRAVSPNPSGVAATSHSRRYPVAVTNRPNTVDIGSICLPSSCLHPTVCYKCGGMNHTPAPCAIHFHHRSVSASPNILLGSAESGAENSGISWKKFRKSPSGYATVTGVCSIGSSYVVLSQHGHPTVFDFKDWRSSLDIKSQDGVYAVFMRAHSCYDLIPVSSKLVVFDTELPVRKAFFALIYNGVRAAPLWNNEKKEFVGMLTITDFIQVLSRYHKNGCTEDGIKELEEHKITTWRKVLEEDGNIRPFVTIDPSENLYHAVEVLCKSRVHRLPLMERNSGDISYILTHKRLIRFLYLYITDLPRPSFMSKTPRELGIGTWKDVLTISMDTPLIDALHVFLEKRVSALPLLDRDGKVVDIFAKFDVINLAAEKIYTNLNMNVRDALKHRSDWFEGVRTCMEDDSLMTVVEIIVKAEVHRLVVTDVDRKVKGIISLSDILRALVLNPPVSEDIDDGGECEQDVAGMEES